MLAAALLLPLGAPAQELDPGWAELANGVNCVIPLDDGRVLAGHSGGITRLRGDGSIDEGFRAAKAASGAVTALAMQRDGKLLVASNGQVKRLQPDGALDPSFIVSTSGSVLSMALQANGQIVLGGGFSAVNGRTRASLARLNPDGSLDESFNPGVNNTVQVLALQSDGKILAGGVFTAAGGTTRNRLARFGADGVLDSDFNPNVSGMVQCLAVQPDGKILLGGFFTTVSGQSRNRIARLHGNGALDAGFNPNANAEVASLALQANGEILVSGAFGTIGNVTRRKLARLDSNGTPDAGFAPDHGTSYDPIKALALQADGKILVGWGYRMLRLNNNRVASSSLQRMANDGITWSRGGSAPECSEVDFAVWDGLAWNSLGRGTKTGTDWQLQATGLGPAPLLKATGRVVSGKGSGGSYWIEQVANPQGALVGSLVTEFGGKVLTSATGVMDFGTQAWLSEGAPLTLTLRNPGGAPLEGLRFGLRGPQASEFRGTALPSTSIAPGQAVSLPLSFRPRGGGMRGAELWVTAGGPFPVNLTITLRGIGLHPQTVLPAETGDAIQALTIQADGKVLAGGGNSGYSIGPDGQPIYGTPRGVLRRYQPAGAEESEFQVAVGHSSFYSGWSPPSWAMTSPQVRTIVQQSDGKILIGGQFSAVNDSSWNTYCLARLMPDGSVDFGFTPNSTPFDTGLYPPAPTSLTAVNAIVVQADGKIVVAGEFSEMGGQPRNGIARFLADGSLDQAFNPFPIHEGSYPVTASFSALAVTPDGGILATGNLGPLAEGGSYRSIVRILANGTLDPRYAAQLSGSVTAMCVLPDGRALVSGNLWDVEANASRTMVRINAAGVVEHVYPDMPAASGLVVQGDGSVILAWSRSGDASDDVAGLQRKYLARLLPDGSLDPEFDPSVDGSAACITLDGKGRLVMGGTFAAVGGEPARNLTMLTNNVPVRQSFAIGADGRVRWNRSGAEPEINGVIFDVLEDGVWRELGGASHTSGAWELLASGRLPTQGYLRARAWGMGGSQRGARLWLDHSAPYGGGAPDIAVRRDGQDLVAGAGLLHFGQRRLDAAAGQIALVVRNDGDGALDPLAATIDGTHAADFQLVGDLPARLEPGQAATVTVTFLPSGTGARSATLRITSNDVDESPFAISLAGDGELYPEIALTDGTNELVSGTSSSNFGEVDLGFDEVKTYQIRNDGSAPLELSGAMITSANSDLSLVPFSGGGIYSSGASGSPGNPSACTLAPGESTSIRVRFAPTATGPRSASLAIHCNDGDENPFIIHLSGVGTGGPVIDADGLDLGSAYIADGTSHSVLPTKRSGVVNLRNTGTTELLIYWWMLDGPGAGDFRVPMGANRSIMPGQGMELQVEFSPTAVGLREASLVIGSNDAAHDPLTIPLAGTGIGRPILGVEQPHGSSLDFGQSHFGSVAPDAAGPAVSFTLRNRGQLDLTNIAVTITGAHPGDFVLAGPAVDHLAAGATAVFSVTFKPSMEGQRSAVLEIASNDPLAQPFRLSLAGSGVPTGDDLYAWSQLAGQTGNRGRVDGLPENASLTDPTHLTCDAMGNVYVADEAGHTIRRIDPLGNVSTFAGGKGQSGSADGARHLARFNQPGPLVADRLGNLYVADNGNHTVRKIDPNGMVTTLAGAVGISGKANGSGTAARFEWINGITVDRTGCLYVTESNRGVIRKITAAGEVSRVAGDETQRAWVDGPPSAARFEGPQGIAADADGNLYIADIGIRRGIRKISTTGEVSTLAGGDYIGSSDGVGTRAGFFVPIGVAVDSLGNVLVCDYGSHMIRKISPEGRVLTIGGGAQIAGTNTGTGAWAEFQNPTGIAVSPTDRVVVADTGNQRIVRGTATAFDGPGLQVVQEGVGRLISGVSTTDYGALRLEEGLTSVTYTLRNAGVLDLADLACVVTGNHASDFTVSELPATSLQPDQAVAFAVNFRPVGTGTRTASLEISSNDPLRNPFVIQLTGIGLAVPDIGVTSGGAVIAAGGRAPEFGPVTTGDSSAAQTFTLTNTGQAELNTLSIDFAGNEAADFVLTTAPPPSLAPGASAPFAVTFRPKGAGARGTVLQIHSNDPNQNPFPIVLTGTGVAAPRLAVSGEDGVDLTSGTAGHDFGAVEVGRTAQRSLQLRLGNDGDHKLEDLAISFAGDHPADFTAVNFTLTELWPTTATTLEVNFVPTGAGPRSATLRIASNDPRRDAFEIHLTGMGLAIPDVRVGSAEGGWFSRDLTRIPLGDVRWLTDSAPLSLKIRNMGTAELEDLSAVLTGPQATEFVLTGEVPGTIAPGEERTVQVVLRPRGGGRREAVLEVRSNDPEQPLIRVQLEGNGIAADDGFRQTFANDISALAGEADGSLLVGGSSVPPESALLRLLPDGSRSGVNWPVAAVNALIAERSGSLLVEDADRTLRRFSPRGFMDASFAMGVKTLDFMSSSVALPDGKWLVGGMFEDRPQGDAGAEPPVRYLARLHADGSLDAGFQPAITAPVGAFAVDNGGRMLVATLGGVVDPPDPPRLLRVLPDGNLDPTFLCEMDGEIHGIVALPDGKWLVAGAFTRIGGETRHHLARLDANGALDTSFKPEPNNFVLAVALQADGAMVVGGDFTRIGGQARARIARINAAGNFDADFDPGADRRVSQLLLREDGLIWAAGEFSVVGGLPQGKLARLLNHTPSHAGLAITTAGSALWSRSGSAPDLTQVGIESWNGTEWVAGTVAREGSNWRASNLAMGQHGWIRATGVPVIMSQSQSLVSTILPYGSTWPALALTSDAGSTVVSGEGTISLGSQPTGSDRATVALTLHNVGTAPLDALRFEFGGNHPRDFTIKDWDGTPIPVGGSRTFRVAFGPTQDGPRHADLRIFSNDALHHPFVVPLTGTGQAPELFVTDENDKFLGVADGALSLPDTLTGLDSEPVSIRICNFGNGPLDQLVFEIVGDQANEFRVQGWVNQVIEPGGFASLALVFNPGAIGPRNARLKISSNDPASPFLVPLIGYGTPTADLAVATGTGDLASGDRLSFADTRVDSLSAPRSLTLRNDGTSPLENLTLSIVSGDGSDFSITPPPLTTLLPGEQTTVSVTFKPTVFGERTATLEISSNDPDENPFVVRCSGTGITAPFITVHPHAPARIDAGTGTTLEAAAKGTAPIFWQWYLGESGDTSKPIPNATTSIHETPPLFGVSHSFWARATNLHGHADTATAVVFVKQPPRITSEATAVAKSGKPFTYLITTDNPAVTFTATGLPTGMSVDPATGWIQGTVEALGTYPVTLIATNDDGSDTKQLILTVVPPSANANLANLALDGATLSPAFASETTGYTSSVSHDTESITLTPTASDDTATVNVNGMLVASGTPSEPIPLITGNNLITTVVTAEDGTTIKTYTVNVTRLSNNANLANLTLDGATLSPAFASGTTSYSASVSHVTDSITLTPTASDDKATVKVNGMLVASGTPSEPIPLITGNNLITSVVTAEDGTTIRTYTVTVTRLTAPPTISTIADLGMPQSASTGALAFVVADDATAVDSLVVSGTSSNTTLVPDAGIVFGGRGANRTVTVTPAPDQSGTATITVTVSDGTQATSASFVITVFPPAPALLELFTGSDHPFDLSWKSVELIPDGTEDYRVMPAQNITALPHDPAFQTALSFPDSDDSYTHVSLSGGKQFPYYGIKHSSVYVTTNGLLMFGKGDRRWGESLPDHKSRKQIAVFWDDLVVTGEGSIRWLQSDDRMTITYSRLREWSRPNENTAQIELFFDGRIRLSYGRVDLRDALVGLSNGKSTAEPRMVDFFDSGPRPPIVALPPVTAVDGYLSGSTAFLDANFNGLLDADESSAETDGLGRFNLEVDAALDTNADGAISGTEGRLVVAGGLDIATGLKNPVPLKAPADASIVSPLTTLVQELRELAPGVSPAEAEALVKTALGIPGTVSLLHDDPIAAALSGTADGLAAFAASAKVMIVLSQATALLAADAPGSASTEVTKALAQAVRAGNPLDLGDSATVSGLLVAASATAPGSVLTPQQLAGAATLIADSNGLVTAALANGTATEGILTAIVQAQRVAQGTVATELAAVAGGTRSIESVLAANSGDALVQLAAQAPVGDITGNETRSGTFEFSTDSYSARENGAASPAVTVVRKSGNQGTVSVVVQLSGGTASPGADYMTGPIVLTFAPGELTRSINLAQVLVDDAMIETSETVNLSLALATDAPTNAVLGSQRAAVLKVLDNDGGFGGWITTTTVPADRRGPLDRNGPLSLTNLEAYGMGVDPMATAAADLPRITGVDAAAGWVRFVYRRVKSTAHVAVVVQASSDLQGWAPALVSGERRLEDGGAWERVEASVAMPATDPLYLRLRIMDTE